MDIDNTEIISSAVKILEPFPWENIRWSKNSLDWEFPYLPPQDDKHAREICENLVWQYRIRVEAENSSRRPNAMLIEMEDLARDCARLSGWLKRLPPEERTFLEGRLGDQLPGYRKVWASPYEVLLKTFRGQPSFDGRNRHDTIDALGRELMSFSADIQMLLNLAKSDFRFRQVKDLGGRVSLNRRFRAPPMWWLVHHSWTLFAMSPHLKPSTTVERKLDEFLGAIHEAATKENLSQSSKIRSTLIRYAGVIKERDEACSDLNRRASRLGLDLSQDELWDDMFLKAELDGHEELQEILELVERIHRVQLTIEFGPALVEYARKQVPEPPNVP